MMDPEEADYLRSQDLDLPWDDSTDLLDRVTLSQIRGESAHGRAAPDRGLEPSFVNHFEVNDSMPWTAEHVKRILTNPFYCLRNIDERLVGEHEPLISEEKFIEGGARLIRELGPEAYLQELLENLKGNFVTDDRVDDDAAAYGYRRT